MSKESNRDPRYVMITCDQCNNTYEVAGTTSFRDAGAEAKAEGWICVNFEGEFFDFCNQDCIDKFKKENEYD